MNYDNEMEKIANMKSRTWVWVVLFVVVGLLCASMVVGWSVDFVEEHAEVTTENTENTENTEKTAYIDLCDVCGDYQSMIVYYEDLSMGRMYVAVCGVCNTIQE